MADTTFTDYVTPVPAAWLNDVNDHIYTNTFSFASGIGGAVTQGTDKSTGVELNKVCGAITMHAASLSNGDIVGFTLTDSSIAATDVVAACIKTGTVNSYNLTVDTVAAGSCHFSLQNVSAAPLAEAVVINFLVLKATAA